MKNVYLTMPTIWLNGVRHMVTDCLDNERKPAVSTWSSVCN